MAVLALLRKSSGEPSASGGPRRGRIRASSLGERRIHRARAGEQAWLTVVPLVTTRLGVESIQLVALFVEVQLDRPRPGPYRGILDCDLVLERVCIDARPPFDEMPVLAGPLEFCL